VSIYCHFKIFWRRIY